LPDLGGDARLKGDVSFGMGGGSNHDHLPFTSGSSSATFDRASPKVFRIALLLQTA
jgi:hypothetical protein